MGTTDRESSNIPRAVKIRAKKYHMHKNDIHRRTAKRFRLVLGEKAGKSIMRILHDEIGYCSFTSLYIVSIEASVYLQEAI